MVVHERMHKGQGRKCDYCVRVFTQPQTLKNHMLIHKQRKHIKTSDPEIRQAQIVKVARGRPSIPQDQKKSNLKNVLDLASPLPLPSTLGDSRNISTSLDTGE